mgnify:CR=1 FL=1
MAYFESFLPYELIQQLEDLGNSTEKIFGEMTQEAAKTVERNVRRNLNKSFKDSSEISKHLSTSRVYKTANGSINTKVLFSGYMINKNGKKVPVPLVVNAREYGSKSGEKKKPFFRKAFTQKEIERVMLEVQDKYIGDK